MVTARGLHYAFGALSLARQQVGVVERVQHRLDSDCRKLRGLRLVVDEPANQVSLGREADRD